MIAPLQNSPDSACDADAADFTEFSTLDHVPHRNRTGMMGKGGRMHQRHLGTQDRLANLFGLVQRNGERFLTEYPLTGLERSDRIASMQRRRQGYIHRIDLIGLASRIQVGRPVLDAESGLPFAKFRSIPTGGQNDFVSSGPNRFDHAVGNPTYSDKGPTHYMADGTKNQRIVSTVQMV